MRARWIPVCVALVLAGCSSGDDDAAPVTTTSSTTSTSTTTSTTAATSTTSTTVFAGGTEPVTTPMDTGRTTLLTDVTVEHDDGVDRVVFEFRGDGLPAVDAQYVDDPRAAGSGDEVEVEGSASLQIRMEPAATVDLTGEEPDRSYDGPDRVRGETRAITEVVRTGDFEANLTWVIGLGTEAPFRIATARAPSRVIVEIAV